MGNVTLKGGNVCNTEGGQGSTRGQCSISQVGNVAAKGALEHVHLTILFFFSYSEVNSTWLITSELANQRARKVLFTCVVYTNFKYPSKIRLHVFTG